nr:hypothetical protein GCM10023233_32970 [Brevibacterium otitidis]
MENWAEIRRLHIAEGVPIKEFTPVGGGAEHSAFGVGLGGAAAVHSSKLRVGGGCV